jgi:hypothetical protein
MLQGRAEGEASESELLPRPSEPEVPGKEWSSSSDPRRPPAWVGEREEGDEERVVMAAWAPKKTTPSARVEWRRMSAARWYILVRLSALAVLFALLFAGWLVRGVGEGGEAERGGDDDDDDDGGGEGQDRCSWSLMGDGEGVFFDSAVVAAAAASRRDEERAGGRFLPATSVRGDGRTMPAVDDSRDDPSLDLFGEEGGEEDPWWWW